MTDQPPRDETPRSTPDYAGQASGAPDIPPFKDWLHRLGPRHQPGSPTSPGNFLYLGMELPRRRKAPPPSPEPPPPQ